MSEWLNEQLLLVATIVGAIAALPTLLEYLVERRKRRERIGLSLDDEAVQELVVRLAGLDDLLAANADIIDAARNPAAYRGSNAGNEILIIGPAMSGKKSLARRIAIDAGIDRLITVHNPRNADALAYAKALLLRYRRQKVMLLIPNVERVFEDKDEELVSELDALIETSSERENVLVVGTSRKFEPDGDLDDLFAIKLMLPGTRQSPHRGREVQEGARPMLRQVIAYYVDHAQKDGFAFSGFGEDEPMTTLLDTVGNPAEVEDIVTLCRTAAVHRLRTVGGRAPEITAEMLRRAIGRVIVTATVDD